MRWCWHGAAALLGSLAACSFPADYEGTRYQCVMPGPGECPDGYECRSGFCEAARDLPDAGGGGTSADASAKPPPDAAAGDDASSGCASVTSVEGLGNGEAWEISASSADCDISFDEGSVALRNLGTEQLSECAARSRDQYLVDGRTWVEAIDLEPGQLLPTFGVILQDQGVLFRLTPKELVFIERRLNGDEMDDFVFGGIPYNPVEHRFWALRGGVGDTIVLETSPDGDTFSAVSDFRPNAANDPRTTCARYEVSIRDGFEVPTAMAFQNLNDVPR